MDLFVLAGKAYHSRLLVGTGRYRDMEQTKAVVEASGAEIVTVAIRRLNPAFIAGSGIGSNQTPPSGGDNKQSLQDIIDPSDYTYLPNSAGCYTAEEAVRTLRLAREMGNWTLVKLEVIGDKQTLYPDVGETLKAAEILIKEGFKVMAYTTDDLIVAKKLEKLGCAAVMPLASPIGSGLGILNPLNIRLIAENLSIPVLVDAGIGTASDACMAMELGCAGVLLNSALADAQDPVLMASAMKAAVIAGRQAYMAGRMAKRQTAVASSPQMAMIE